MTGDKDLAQLVGERDHWWDFARRRRLDAAGVHQHFGVHPHQIADFLALTGDAVDNIPGVPASAQKPLRHCSPISATWTSSTSV